ncbi:MAG TPA: protein kinase, partial [Thermoguttaceae bacterium]|nr:protein kinase [Thermoguttaceae bacterium]
MESIVQQALENYGFKIAPRIGWGGFAEVHEAYSAEGVPCAIKVSLHPLDEADSEIRRELENLNYLKMLPGHPRIVTLMDIWMIGGYLVTRWELAPGEGELAPGKKIRSLEDMLRYYELVGQQGIPLSKLIRYIYETAQAIDFLNEKGIYHRDIKPSNLLLFWDRVKVGDVGLAKFIGASIGSHSRLGTLGYLPLEAWDQGVLHPTVDIYSLAATYVKLRTGREPFGTKPKEILDNQTLGKPCLEGLGDAEKLVVMQALAADPAARPQHGAVQWVRELYAAIRAPDSPPPLGPVSQMVVSDAHSLIRAVANAPPGAIIYLQPGTYRLPKGLQIKKSLLLRGSGKENTYILVDTPGRAAISYLGTGLFSVRDLSVEYIGLGPADVLSASSGVVDIRNCVFQGGKWADGSGVFGAGVRLQGIVRGTLHGCICRKNTYGICVSEQAQPTLEENQCLENATGIAYFGTSSGVARKNI